MSADAITTRDAGGMVVAANLLYPGQQDPVGRDPAGAAFLEPSPLCYVIWIRPRPERFPDELCARWALHVNHCAGGAP
jgi:hypothetical protein